MYFMVYITICYKFIYLRYHFIIHCFYYHLWCLVRKYVIHIRCFNVMIVIRGGHKPSTRPNPIKPGKKRNLGELDRVNGSNGLSNLVTGGSKERVEYQKWTHGYPDSSIYETHHFVKWGERIIPQAQRFLLFSLLSLSCFSFPYSLTLSFPHSSHSQISHSFILVTM